MPEFNDLPLELKLTIFETLDPKSLELAGRVSRTWRTLTRNNVCLWQSPDHQEFLKQKYVNLNTPPEQKPHKIRIHCLGDHGVGKTSFLMRYCLEKFDPDLLNHREDREPISLPSGNDPVPL